jgi:DNA invertase Pin-like site-specific DNA recombinase
MIAELEADVTRARSREGMAVAKATGRIPASSPSSSPARKPTWSTCGTPAAATAELAELFSAGRSTVYRAIRRGGGHITTSARWRCKNPAR